MIASAGAADQKNRTNRNQSQQPVRVIEDINLRPGETVADIGCGSGYLTFRLADAVGADGKVLAEDITEKSLPNFSFNNDNGMS